VDKGYIVDKTENNPTQIHDHPGTQLHITCDGYHNHGQTPSLSRIFDLSKFGQAHGRHYEFILCGARILALSAVGSLCESEAGQERPWNWDLGKYQR